MEFKDYDQQSIFWICMENWKYHLNNQPGGEIHQENARFVPGGRETKLNYNQHAKASGTVQPRV